MFFTCYLLERMLVTLLACVFCASFCVLCTAKAASCPPVAEARARGNLGAEERSSEPFDEPRAKYHTSQQLLSTGRNSQAIGNRKQEIYQYKLETRKLVAP